MLFTMLLHGNTSAQVSPVTGTVLSEDAGALQGVRVLIRGTTLGTVTDRDGKYTIGVPGPDAVLVFSLTGYKTVEAAVNDRSVVDVILSPDNTLVSKPISTGYTNQPVGDITGSVALVDPGELKAIPVGNISNQLQGRASGVNVIGSGQPGTTSKVRIRGFSSFWNNEPLYVVDGVPTQDISFMNPNDIETLCVLKDAGAAAVFGSRASNGVIIINTRKGNKGIKVSYDMFIGTQQPGKGPTKDLLNTQEYADLQWLVYQNDGTFETHPIYGPSTNQNPTLPSWAANTDWYDAITDPAGIQNHDLTFTGGTDKARYFVGLGYFKQNGIVIHTHTERYSTRFNSDWTLLNDRIRVGENLALSFRSSLGVPNLEENSPIQIGPYRTQPIIPVKWTGPDYVGLSHTFTAGDWGGTGIAPRLGNSRNVVADLTRNKDNKYHDIRLFGSFYLDVLILKGLNFRSTIGGSWTDGYGINYIAATYENAENTTASSLSENAYWGSDWVWTNSLVLDKVMGKHRVLAVAGYEALRYGIGRAISAARRGYFSDAVDFRTLTNGATITAANSTIYTPVKVASAFLKADYGFMDRYLMGVTIRHDGCSLFGENNRYAIFPSFSAGWRISREGFMKGIGFLSELKIRGSYGLTGNQFAISSDNQSMRFGGNITTSYYDLNGTGNSAVPGYYPIRFGNSDTRWETNRITNIGFETQLWKNTFGVVFDWYLKKSSDLLFTPELQGTTGTEELPYVNVAAMKNTGVDLELSYNNTWSDFGFHGSFNFTTYKNEITRITDGIEFWQSGYSRMGSIARNQTGHPLSAFYGYKVIGLFKHENEVDMAPTQDGAEPGFFRFANAYVDLSTDVYFPYQQIDSRDRVFIGDPNPDFTYGFNLGFNYKHIDLSAFIYGSQGNDIFNLNKWWTDFWSSFQGQKSHDLLYNSWTPGRTGASVPKASNKSNFSTNTQVCSYYIENGSYLRLKSLQIGYTMPERYLTRTGIESLRFFLQGVNLFTITKYSGLDPEISGYDLNFGIDAGNYPNARQFIFGINLTL
jgi:TonB-linked SusC/RagA family outer membrane protein